MEIIKNKPPTETEVKEFLSKIDFLLPNGYLEFFKNTNGAEIYSSEEYLLLCPITDLFILNEEYTVETFIPDFFLIGSDGGDTAYAIERNTGKIFEMPFIGMSKDEALFRFEDFNKLLVFYDSLGS